METASKPTDPPRDDSPALPALVDLELNPPGETAIARRIPGASAAGARRRRWSVAARQELLWITAIYLAVRGLLLLVAYLDDSFAHHNFLGQLAHWDGLWYRQLANHGYPAYVSHAQTTLGFFPLFPIAIWLLEPVFTVLTTHNQVWAATVAGLVISAAGGWVATVMVHRLAEGWWGREAARRATVLFIVFPGSVVFSMVYSEGLLLPLAAGCLYALERRRWVLAGVLAGFGSAVQPVGLMLPVLCASGAALELHRSGWRLRDARRCLIAPLLSVTGAAAFLVFLWIWTGNPFASYIAQHHGWGEKTDALAVVHLATRLAPSFDPSHLNHPIIDLNLLVGLVGAVILAAELVMMWFARREISVVAIVWTIGITFFALTSEYVPPNPRMLITAFPALMVVGRYAKGRWFAIIVFASVFLLAGLSCLTFVGHTLRP